MPRRAGTAQLLPPYASYSSWVKLLEAFSASMPPIIDEAYMSRLALSGSGIKALKSALRFLGLVGSNDRPTERLEHLVEALGDGQHSKSEVLREVMSQAYAPLFSPDFDLKSANGAQLRSYFATMGARGQIQQKCTSFFLNLAKDAGLQLSPHLISRPRPASGPRRTLTAELETEERRPRPQAVEQRRQPLAPSREAGLLLGMFPRFDIDWPEDKKTRWFKDFAQLMRLFEMQSSQLSAR